MASTIYSKLLILLSLFLYISCDKDCTLDDECSCSFSDGSGKVDLTSLGNTDDTPRFKDVMENKDDEYYYSYNPCGGFTEGHCQDAASCVITRDKSEQRQIGDASKAAFQYEAESKNVIVTYNTSGVLRLTSVNLVCDKSACHPTFTAEGQQGGAGPFEMTLTTVCACPGGCDASGPKNCSGGGGGGGGGAGGLSGGPLLCILFFSLLAVYMASDWF